MTTSQRAKKQGTHVVVDAATGKRHNSFREIERAAASVTFLEPQVIGLDEVDDITARPEIVATADALCDTFQDSDATIQITGKQWGSRNVFTTATQRVVANRNATTFGKDVKTAGEVVQDTLGHRGATALSAELIGTDTFLEIDTTSGTVHVRPLVELNSDVDTIDSYYAKPSVRVSKQTLFNDGSVSNPVAVNDPRVQAGEVFDHVNVDGTVFSRRQTGVFPGTPYAMRLQADRKLSDADIQKTAQLLGYQYAATVAGERLGGPVRDTPYSIVLAADTTKSQRDDLGMALEDFEETLSATITDGSPVRKTNRAGAGTQGTRLVEGFGTSSPAFEIYYDDTYESNQS